MRAFLLAVLLSPIAVSPLRAAVIAGAIRDLDGVGVANVQVTLSGAFSQITVTNSTGSFSFSGIAIGGSYTVTPARSGVVFTPLTRSYPTLPADEGNADFTLGKTWGGGGVNALASNPANWTAGIAPLSNDLVRFDGTNPTKGCVWDVTTLVDTMQFKASYSSSVVAVVDIIVRNMEIGGGEFLMGSREIQIQKNFTHTGGVFRATPGGLAHFNGTTQQLISMVPAPLGNGLYDSYFSGFRVTTSSSVRLNSDVIVDGTFNISAGRFDMQRSTMTLTGGTQSGAGGTFIWDDSGGTLLPGSGGVMFNSHQAGVYQVRQAGLNSFNNLMAAGSTVVNVSTAIKVNRLVTVGDTDFNPSLNLGNGFFHTFSGTVTIGPVASPSFAALSIGASTVVFQNGLSVAAATLAMRSGQANVRGGLVDIGAQAELLVDVGNTGRFVFSNGSGMRINTGSLRILGDSVFVSSSPGSARFGVEVNGAVDINASCDFDSLNSTGMWIRGAAQPAHLDGLHFRNGPIGGAALNFDPVPVASITISTPSFDATISTNVRAIVDAGIQADPDIFVVLSTGSHIGPAYEYDPSAVVHWGKLGVPGNFAGTTLGVSSITWSWSITNFPLSFYVVSSTGGQVSPPLFASMTSWTETDLTPNTAYARAVRAVTDIDQADSTGATVFSEAGAPSGLAFSGIFISSVVFSWGINGNPANTVFEIDRSTDNVGYSQLTRNTHAALVPYSDTGLIPETSYYYRVFAENGSGTPSVGLVFIATRTQAVPPPRVATVQSSTAPNLGLITLVVTGAYFQDGAVLRLKRSGSNTVLAQNVVVDDQSLLHGSVRLTGVPAGTWDVEVENPDGKISINTGIGLFTVENAVSVGDITIGNYTGSGSLSLPTTDNGALLSISSSAFAAGRVYISGDPLASPLSISSSLIASATAALKDWIFIPGTLREILAFTQQGLYTLGFNKPVTLGITFPDTDHDGIIDTVTLRRVTLRMMTLNEDTGQWELLPARPIDIVRNRVTAPLSHFSVYALFGSPAAADLSEAKVYPSPWKPGSGGAFDADHLTFSELTESGEVRIYSAAAKLVKVFRYDPTQAGIAPWDGRDDNGAPLKSGMYLIYIKSSEGDTVKIKLGVER